MSPRSLLLSAALLVGSSASVRAGETVAVVVAGRSVDSVPAYKMEGEPYLDAERIGGLYGGRVYWRQVSGQVLLTLRGRTMQFTVDANKATSGEAAFALSAPVRVRVSRAFIPISLLTSEDFERWSGFDAHYDSATATLQLDRRATVGPVRVYSYKDHSRVSVELGVGVTYQVTPRGVGAFDVTVPYGAIDVKESVPVGDGVVVSYSTRQEARLSRVTVHMATPGLRWKASELIDPPRLVVDVYAPGAAVVAGDAPAAARAAQPASQASQESPPRRAAGARKRIIVVDAGHGGKDPGAVGARGTQEKDITLLAARELARLLRERGDFEVVLTRDDDFFVPLSDRSKRANDLDADLFVSLHCNSSSDPRESGFEVYTVSETASDPEAQRLAAAENAALELEGKKPEDETASLILLAMTKTEMLNESAPFAALVERALLKRVDVVDRGAKQAGFYVLRGTHAPAILVEMAYLSHPREEAELGSKSFRRKIAQGIAAGIGDYARKKGWL